MRRETEVAVDAKKAPITIPEMSTGGESIESIGDLRIDNIVEMEEFMNQIMVIMVYEDNREGALKVICPSVNGKQQPILRGSRQKVRRKYVESLARSTVTNFDQRRRDPADPASLVMVPVVRQTYPFSIIHDPDPRGGAWLEQVMHEAMTA